jgi:hypothetical protein
VREFLNYFRELNELAQQFAKALEAVLNKSFADSVQAWQQVLQAPQSTR